MGQEPRELCSPSITVLGEQRELWLSLSFQRVCSNFLQPL